MYSISSDTKNYLNEINLNTDNISENSSSTEKATKIMTHAKIKDINELKGWKDKPLHGKYPKSDPDVNSSLIHYWLYLLGLKSEIEGFNGAGPESTNEKFSSKHIIKWC